MAATIRIRPGLPVCTLECETGFLVWTDQIMMERGEGPILWSEVPKAGL